MRRIDLCISTRRAQKLALGVACPIGGALSAAYALAWGPGVLTSALRRAITERPVASIGVLIAGVVLHEALHAVGWTVASDEGWDTVSFGFQLKSLTPYAHIDGPISVRAYRVGTLLPGAALGILPWAIGLATRTGLLGLFGVVFAVSATGDLMALWLLRCARPDQRVEDHPERVGVYLLVEDDGEHDAMDELTTDGR